MSKLANQAGFSLIGAMIAVAITAFTAMVFMHVLTGNLRGVKKLQLDTERQAIARHILGAISCSETFKMYDSINANPKTKCVNGAAYAIYNRRGEIIISANNNKNHTRFGKWSVRALCVNTGTQRGFHIEAARIIYPDTTPGPLYNNDPASFARDPYTGQIAKWAIPSAALYPATARPCAEDFADDSPTPPPSPTPSNSKCVPGQLCEYKGLEFEFRTGPITMTSQNDCNPSLWSGNAEIFRDASKQRVVGIFDPNYYTDNNYHFIGQVLCPSGMTAVAGGSDCQAERSPGVLLTSKPVQVLATGQPIGWYSDCCKPRSGKTTYQGGVWVQCKKEVMESLK